jgi:hypothetical protein
MRRDCCISIRRVQYIFVVSYVGCILVYFDPCARLPALRNLEVIARRMHHQDGSE